MRINGLVMAAALATGVMGCVPPREPDVPVQVSTAAVDVGRFQRLIVLPKVGRTGVLHEGTYFDLIDSTFSGSLLGKGYLVLERTDLDRVLQEIAMQSHSGLTQTERVIKAGKMLNADGLIIVSLDRDDTGYETDLTVSAKFVDIECGRQLWVGSYSGRRPGRSTETVAQVLQAIAAAFPSKVAAPVPAAMPAPSSPPKVAPVE